MPWFARLAAAAAAGSGAAAGYVGLVTGALPVDVGVGRRTRNLGPQLFDIDAPCEVVFDVLEQPYLGRATRAMREKVAVLERGQDMVLAAHYTPVAGGRLTATTVETVRFTRPDRIDFRLVRGPVPHVVETFELRPHGPGTRLEYRGEMGTDGWAAGERWGRTVARAWEKTVTHSLETVRAEAERRTGERSRNG